MWQVDLVGRRGHEQTGKRPAVIISESNRIVQVVPLTSNIKRADFSHTVVLYPNSRNGLDVASVALVFQIVSLDLERFTRRLGMLSDEDIESVDYLLRDLLHL